MILSYQLYVRRSFDIFLFPNGFLQNSLRYFQLFCKRQYSKLFHTFSMIGGQFFKSCKIRKIKNLTICQVKFHIFQGDGLKKYYIQINLPSTLFKKVALNFVAIIFWRAVFLAIVLIRWLFLKNKRDNFPIKSDHKINTIQEWHGKKCGL